VRLGHAKRNEIKKLIDAKITFEDIFEYTTPDQQPEWEKAGFKRIRAGHSGDEYLKLKKGKEQAAAFLEPRRYGAMLGATTEFNKMEGVAVDPTGKKVYIAMSYVDKGMTKEEGAPADHIQLPKLKAGSTYAVDVKSKQKDQTGKMINSDWVGTAMYVPEGLMGEDIAVDGLGNIAAVEKVANPDNIFFSDKMRTLFVGEDSGTHVNNFVWAYNVDTRKLTRILSVASGAESTGLQAVDNMNGHAYIMSNLQHQGEWIKSMPEDVKKRLSEAAKQSYGVNKKDTPNYYLDANVGYLGGMPGL
jgi:secreted PhoX family phosphatase